MKQSRKNRPRESVEALTSSTGSDETEVAAIASEEEDRASSPPSYEVVTYPADFTLEVLVSKLTGEPPEIDIPGFQRRFVWTQAQASKLIESFLLGLPVPPIFVFTDANNIQMVVDGQQRLKSIGYFFEGYFGPEAKGRRPVFRLTGLNEKSPYYNLSRKDLETDHPSIFRKLKDSVLRAFVIKQLNPSDNTCVYHVFERLNTGGTLLKGQEIRNCVYAGLFNDLLVELNTRPSWREIFGKRDTDKRQRDAELVLRFLALLHDAASYKKPMKDFLSDFMKAHQAHEKVVESRIRKKLARFRTEFTTTADVVLESLGPRPFHITAGLNAAAFDSVFVAFAHHREKIPRDIKIRYEGLKGNRDFQRRISSHTTDNEAVADRLSKAEQVLFG
jgi:hypothetical protein